MKEDEMGAACGEYGKMMNTCKTLIEMSEGKRPLGRLDADGAVMLKCILGKSGEMVWIELISLRIVTGVAPM
jgi:hypothetical protein